jgi:hypothetical protein
MRALLMEFDEAFPTSKRHPNMTDRGVWKQQQTPSVEVSQEVKQSA